MVDQELCWHIVICGLENIGPEIKSGQQPCGKGGKNDLIGMSHQFIRLKN